MKCNDMDYITFTNIQKMHFTLMNSKVSKNIRNQGETLFCWAFAISSMLRESLNCFIVANYPDNLSDLTLPKTVRLLGVLRRDALTKLNSDDFHRQLRNELIMIPIPKILSNEHNDYAPLSQGHYLHMAFERVSYFKRTPRSY